VEHSVDASPHPRSSPSLLSLLPFCSFCRLPPRRRAQSKRLRSKEAAATDATQRRGQPRGGAERRNRGKWDKRSRRRGKCGDSAFDLAPAFPVLSWAVRSLAGQMTPANRRIFWGWQRGTVVLLLAAAADPEFLRTQDDRRSVRAAPAMATSPANCGSSGVVA
jgi:hypothetical protein